MARYEWDEQKYWRNVQKHDVAFELAKGVFDDPHAVTVPDTFANDEERWRTIGSPRPFLILVVIHTDRGVGGEQLVRIISARKATRKERRTYEEGSKET